MPKISKAPRENRTEIQAKTRRDIATERPGDWWNSSDQNEMAMKLLSTAAFLKTQNQYRYRQASLYAQLYGNMPLFGAVGTNLFRIAMKNQLPSNRPTMSVITSITDTVVSRICMNKPRPIFLTDNGDYKQRDLAKQMNGFIAGEFYQTGYYRLRKRIVRDACIWGTGCVKILEDTKKRVSLERRLATQLLFDANDAFHGNPRQMYELTLIDRKVLADIFPKKAALISGAENAYPDSAGSNSSSVADLLLVVEGWRLPSGPDAGDGLHAIACTAGALEDHKQEKDKFPFEFLHYSEPVVGPWGSGVAERQMGNQAAINQILMTIHNSIRLVGVPRVFVEDGSKVVKAQLNNDVGSIVTYRGTKPSYEVAPCVPSEMYEEVQNVVNRAYQEEGISQLAAASEKPAGLDSGEAIREYDAVQQDRLATLSSDDEDFAIAVAYQVIDKAREICERDGKYQTVYPDKNGTKQIDLPASKLLDDPFVIQCFDMSSLPRDPSGRAAKITEWVQAGLYSPQEGRRLMGLQDTEQEDKLLSAAEERILKQLDDIVESGKFTPPDPFTDLQLAQTISVQYYNLYMAAGLEERKAKKLRQWNAQVQALMMAATVPTPQIPSGSGVPQAAPEPVPTNAMIPNVPSSGQGFARGGMVGYASGGDVMSDQEVEAQERQKQIQNNYGLTPAQGLMASLPGVPGQNTFGLNPQQVSDLQNRGSSDLVSGVSGAANLPVPAAIGAIRKTPTGTILGTVSNEAMSEGEKAVQKELAEQAMQKDLYSAKPVEAPEPNESMLDRVKARFGNSMKEEDWDKLKSIAEKKNSPYTPITLDDAHAGFYPNYEAKPTGVIGDPKDFSNPKNIFKTAEQFNWADNKYGASKQLLERHSEAGLPVKVTTANDLIAHDDYIDKIPQGSHVDIVIPHPLDLPKDSMEKMAAIEKNGTMSLPSTKRLVLAYNKLKENGISTRLVVPSKEGVTPIDPFSLKKLLSETKE